MLKINASRIVPVILGTVPTRADLHEQARRLGDAARSEWTRLAQQELKTSTATYVDGIGDPQIKRGGREVHISLEGMMPNMIEHGWPGGNMREFLAHAGAPNAKQGKEGQWYNHIPFRHGTPGTGGRNVGRPMNKKVYEAAKQLSVGGRLNHKKMVDAKLAKLITRKIRRWHHSGRYEGLTNTGGGYMTFRTISEKNPRGWIHPGIRARRLANKVQDFVAEMAGHLLDESLRTKRGS